MEARKQFTKEHVSWPMAKWRNILCSDVFRIELFDNMARGTLSAVHLMWNIIPGLQKKKTVKYTGAKINGMVEGIMN